MIRRGRRTLAALFALGTLILAPAPSQAQPDEATIGLYLSSLSSLNMGAGTFAADFWLWSTTRSTRFSPLKTMDIINEVQKELEPIGSEQFGDLRWDQRRVRVTGRGQWRLPHFPFDTQTIEILLEDSFALSDDLVYVPDRANSGILPSLKIPGWRLLGWDFQVIEYAYPTSFGHPEKSGPIRASRLIFTIELAREGLADFIELTLGAFVAFTILALTFRMNSTVPPIFAGRMGVIVASVFTVTISLRGVNSSLDLPIGSTLVDQIHLLTLAAGFAAAISAAVARHFAETGREATAIILDRRAMPIFIGFYVVATLVVLIPALVS